MVPLRKLFFDAQPFWSGQLFAVGTIAAATLSQQLMGPLLAEEMPHMPFVAGVLVAALCGGWRAGVTSTLLGALFANWAFVGGYGRFDTQPHHLWAAAFFVVIGLGLVCLVERTSRAVRRQAELNAKLEMVNGELQHRISNVIAIVQGLARQSAAHASSAAELYEHLSNRLAALAAAQRLLKSESGPVSLNGLLTEVLLPFDDGRIQVGSDAPEAQIAGESAAPLALALHELATNAMKHGGLSSPQGRVVVHSSAAGPRVQITWRELGGPPVRAPTRLGFGSRLLRSALPRGDIRLEYAPAGVRCSIDLAAA